MSSSFLARRQDGTPFCRRPAFRGLAMSVAVAALLPATAGGQSLNTDCTLVEGVLPADCRQPNAGVAVSLPRGENTELETFDSDLGEEGFVISIDTPEPGAAPVFLEGNRASYNELRRIDRVLDAANVEVRFDGLNIEPRLAVSTGDMRRTYVAGDTVTFRSATNYPAYIARSEVRVVDLRNPGRVIAVVPIAANGLADWRVPATGAAEMAYSLRVYDARGRYDETRYLPISRSAARQAGAVLTGPAIAPGEGEDMARRRTIPVTGGAITVYSDNATPGTTVNVMGETVPVDAGGAFVVQRILPPGVQTVRVGLGQQTIRREVEIPEQDWFYVATVDLTALQDDGEWESYGRVAGYAKGRTASGYEITAAIDTGERDLDQLFRDLDAKEPQNVLDAIRDEDVYLTFGDDSTLVDDAPTSGKLYLEVKKDNSELLLGDFQLAGREMSLVRSDRTLYGLRGIYETLEQTPSGEPRATVTGYVASPDRLAQRDVFDATGGTFYALRRQGAIRGSSTVLVQYRDPVSGRIVSQTRLAEGRDYEINHFQGVVQLSRPLGPFAGDGLLSDNGLGRYETELVVQYEYVPSVADVDGQSAGVRGEVWATDQLRFGASYQKETTGLADNELMGVDVLWRRSDLTYMNLQWARSEGPGFGTDRSINGGFDFDTGTSAGAIGLEAEAVSLEAAADLGEVTNGRMQGSVSAYYDRKERGFVSADYDIAVTQQAWGLAANMDLGPRTGLILGYDAYEDDTGREREDTRVGLSFALNPQWTAEVQALRTDRADPAATDPAATGARTDVGARLTYAPSEDYKAWIFAQQTVERSGGLARNDRYGVGAEARLSDQFTGEIEISDGSAGTGGYAGVTYEPNAGTQHYLGYRLDALRAVETTGFSGNDGGTFVAGSRARMSDTVTLRQESTWDRAGDRPSLASTFGVTYTPSDMWTYDLGLIYGEREDPATGTLDRRGMSFGVHYTNGEATRAGISGEYRVEDGDDDTLDRRTWGFSAYGRQKLSEEFRLLANVDALVSDANGDFRDGRYIEANVGMAYRPITNDRLNALFRYTYLEDLPGPDQVNIEGDVNGPRQKSHILSADMAYDLNRQWTLGAKYGFRKAEVETARNSGSFVSNTAHLGVLRLDYHVTSLWDITAEARVMKFVEADVVETGAMVGAWRHFGNNLKVGVGYQFNDVDDDLRRIEGRSEGAFINMVAKF